MKTEIFINSKGGEDFINHVSGFIGRVVEKSDGRFIIDPKETGDLSFTDPSDWFRFYNRIAELYQIAKRLKPIIDTFRVVKTTVPAKQFQSNVSEVQKLLAISPQAYGLKDFDQKLVDEIFINMINDLN